MLEAALAQAVTQSERKKVRVKDGESLADVARLMLNDVRAAPLLADMNPSLPRSGPLASGAVVIVPGKEEARKFAARMGFQLGYDPTRASGTARRRAFQKLNNAGAPVVGRAENVDALAASLLGQGLSVADVAKRLVKGREAAALDAFAAGEHAGDVGEVAQAVDSLITMPKAQAALAAALQVLTSTLRASSRPALLEAAVNDGAALGELLDATLVAGPLKAALLEKAKIAHVLVDQAHTLSLLDKTTREHTIGKLPKEQRGVVAALVDARALGVAVVDGDRLAALGLKDVIAALDAHLGKLKEAFERARDALPRMNPHTAAAIVGKASPQGLAKPWPLIVAVARALEPALSKAPVTSRDQGLGGLVPKKTSSLAQRAAPSGAPLGSLSVASLQARAAVGARRTDETNAIAERSAPVVLALFDLLKPCALDGAPAHARAACRKAELGAALGSVRPVRGDGVATLVEELLNLCERTHHRAAVQALGKEGRKVAVDAARALVQPLSVNQRALSETGRALVLCALVLDREVGSAVARQSGREALVQAVVRNAPRILSRASVLVGGPASHAA